jgi:hypothetical protein
MGGRLWCSHTICLCACDYDFLNLDWLLVYVFVHEVWACMCLRDCVCQRVRVCVLLSTAKHTCVT